jgi:hypothetical protein
LPDVPEQGLEIGWQRIAGRVQVPHHLVQIISEPHELGVNQPLRIVVRLGFQRGLDTSAKQHRASEMNRAHAERGGALLNATQFTRRQADIELPIARF